jgi:hypothetical protein
MVVSISAYSFGAEPRTGDPAREPLISLNPADATYAKSATLRAHVNAMSPDGGYLTYKWYISGKYNNPLDGENADHTLSDSQKTAIKTGAAEIADQTSAILTATTPSEAGYYYYWAVITNNKDANDDGLISGDDETALHETSFATIKIIGRSSKNTAEKYNTYQYLYPSLQNGDFSVLNQTGTLAANPVPDANGFPGYGWQTTHYSRTLEIRGNANYVNDGYTGYNFSAQDEIRSDQHGAFCELSASAYSSIFQEISTVPGKVYEWSIDHITRKPYAEGNAVTNRPDVLAVVIGANLNEAADYGSTTSYYNKVNANTAANATYTTAANGGPYVYGTDRYTYFQAIVDQVMVDNGIAPGEYNSTNRDEYFSPDFNSVDRSYTTTYNGSVYYVFLSSATRDMGPFSSTGVSANGSRWRHRSGVYTVPKGQGTSVFAFVNIYSQSAGLGNVLDNISFQSGSPISDSQAVSYTGETKLSAATKAGYAYGLVEIRGSSTIMLTGLNAQYSATPGGAGASIAPEDALGTGGWYTKSEGAPFAANGEIVFKDLTPGKTYRIIGIPTAAISTGLHTNESPANVLDDGYYEDVKILGASGGTSAGLGNIEVEIVPPNSCNITVNGTKADVEYALLSESGTAGKPDISTPAASWMGGGGLAK